MKQKYFLFPSNTDSSLWKTCTIFDKVPWGCKINTLRFMLQALEATHSTDTAMALLHSCQTGQTTAERQPFPLVLGYVKMKTALVSSLETTREVL